MGPSGPFPGEPLGKGGTPPLSAGRGRRDPLVGLSRRWDPPSPSARGRRWRRPPHLAASLQVCGSALVLLAPGAGRCPAEGASANMEEAPLLGGMPGPEDEMVPDLFGADSRFVSENMTLKVPVRVKAEEDEFHVFKDPYLSPADPKEPLLHAFNPALNMDCENKVKVELLVDENEEEILGEFPSLPELDPLEDAVLPSAPPQAYNVHFLSSLLAPHRSPAVVPLGAWALEGATHPGVRVIPVRAQGEVGTPFSPPRVLAHTTLPSTSVVLCLYHPWLESCIPNRVHPFVTQHAPASQGILPAGEFCPGSLVQTWPNPAEERSPAVRVSIL